jgi:hypothetical protein
MKVFYSAATNGFYDPDIHGDAMPTDVVEIKAEHYQVLMQGQCNGCQIVADDQGRPLLHDPLADPAAALAHAKAMARVRLKDIISERMVAFTRGIPAAEVASWPQKAEAARAMLRAARDEVAPVIQIESISTGEDPTVLAQKIVAKADAYAGFVADATGLRRAALMLIDACADVAGVEALLSEALANITLIGVQTPVEPPVKPAARSAGKKGA